MVHGGIFACCLALFLAFDFTYSSLVAGEEKLRPARIANPVYGHGLAANFDGYDVWGNAAASETLNMFTQRLQGIGDAFFMLTLFYLGLSLMVILLKQLVSASTEPGH